LHLKSLKQPSLPELKGSISSPCIKPLEKGVLKMTLPKSWNNYDALYVTAYGVDGKEIFTWSFPITRPADLARTVLKASGGNKINLREEDSIYAVSVNGVGVHIHKRTGLLQQVKSNKGIIPLTNGPVVQEAANNFSGFTHRFIGDTLLIESTFDRKKSYNTLQWSIFPSGIIRMRVRYFPEAYFTWFDGVNFSFPESKIKGVRYMGNGPYRVWKNRLKGNQFGVWKKDYNNTETGESWVYPEFRGYHSNMYWCTFHMDDQSFTVYTDNEDLYFRLFTPAYKTDQWHNYEPIFPGGDISFMQGISSIGTKTQRAETTGPMGMKNIFYDYEKDPGRALEIVLYFDFRSEETTSNQNQ
jgi:hypothetical protein